MSKFDYSSASHEVMYREIHAGPGPQAGYDIADRWHEVADRLVEINEILAAAVREIFSAHEGVGAEGVSGALLPLVPWAEAAAGAARARSVRVAQQADALGFVQHEMPAPIPQVDLSAAEFGSALAGPDAAALGAQNRASANAEERARELMAGYQSMSNQLLDSPERFEPAPAVVAEVGPLATGVHGGGVSGGGGGGVPGMSGGPVTVSPQAVAPSPPGAPPAVGPQGSPAAGPGPGSGGGFGPGANRPRSPGVPVSPAAVGRGSPAGRGAGGGGRGGRFGGVGPGGMPGRSAGPVDPGAPGQGNAVGRAAGAARAGTVGPVGAMGGAGRGRGEDEREHQRPSYLIEQDEDAIVGTLDPVAPPVIGRPDWQE